MSRSTRKKGTTLSQVHLVIEFIDLGYHVQCAFTDKANADSACEAMREAYRVSPYAASGVHAECIYQVESIEVE